MRHARGALVFMASMLMAAPAQAGLTWFSRANCFNNESISWDWPGRSYWLWTSSHHRHGQGWQSPVQTGWEYGFRSAAVHWGEGLGGGWYVVGDHYQWIEGRGTFHLGRTEAEACNFDQSLPRLAQAPQARTGRMQLAGIDEMPLPVPAYLASGEAPAAPRRAADGFSWLRRAPGEVRQFHAHLEYARETMAGQLSRDPSRMRLSFTPALAPSGSLFAASPCGTVKQGAWTGLERFFSMEGGGGVRLTEFDLDAADGMFTMLREAVNTDIGGQAAISVVFVDGEGRSVEEVLWVREGRLLVLTYGAGGAGGAGLSAVALARELL